MIACFDVHYFKEHANAAAVLLNSWEDPQPADEIVVRCEISDEYVAGSFYKRELAPLKQVIERIPKHVDQFVIDAYCHLDAQASPGLGAYLFEEVSDVSLIIGVAKNRFRDSNHAAELYRGKSERPLFITSIGIEYEAAAMLIQAMAGDFRSPSMLKAVDRLARDGKPV